jgi:hypothetical protein
MVRKRLAWISVLFLAPLLFAAPQQTFDIIIKGGRVLDGAGNPWFAANVGIIGDRVVYIGRSEAPAKRVIDAAGLYVAPGFIDMMDQSGGALRRDGKAQSKVRQGVTTAIAGEGGTPGPADQLDKYFDQLHDILSAIHDRGVAYVDLNKPENVLLGEDTKPYLLDFQISFAPNNLWAPLQKIFAQILRQLQTEDWYHFSKHKRHLRPDLMTPDDYIRSYQRSLPIRLHRIIAMPYFAIRHFIMDLLNLKSVE